MGIDEDVFELGADAGKIHNGELAHSQLLSANIAVDLMLLMGGQSRAY
ncbi:MAG: hypothetical protein ACLP7P_07760 [Rhodomicrobium sp.]